MLYLFVKKFVNRDVDCCPCELCSFKTGVEGADPRLHAFSYDVSEKRRTIVIDCYLCRKSIENNKNCLNFGMSSMQFFFLR